ncbi:Mce protein [Mycobacterium sp. NBC_00419]
MGGHRDQGRAAVEDQQSASGDLTEAAAAEEEALAPESEQPAARKWLTGKRTALVVGAAAALFVAGGAFAGAAVQPYLADRAAVATKLDIAKTSAEAITTLWTYTPDDMDKLPERSAKYLSGDFQDQYRKYVDAIVPTNKQAQVTNNTQVVGTAVESLHGDEATALVYTNTTSTSPLTKNIPAMRYLSYRLQLTRDGGHWLVTKMTTVTSLDLTPQL